MIVDIVLTILNTFEYDLASAKTEHKKDTKFDISGIALEKAEEFCCLKMLLWQICCGESISPKSAKKEL